MRRPCLRSSPLAVSTSNTPKRAMLDLRLVGGTGLDTEASLAEESAAGLVSASWSGNQLTRLQSSSGDGLELPGNKAPLCPSTASPGSVPRKQGMFRIHQDFAGLAGAGDVK